MVRKLEGHQNNVTSVMAFYSPLDGITRIVSGKLLRVLILRGGTGCTVRARSSTRHVLNGVFDVLRLQETRAGYCGSG
jgi:hypothetical protein